MAGDQPRPEPLACDTTPPALRVALYSHDTMGLGHTRRNLLLAQTLSASSVNADILLIAGAGEVQRFAFPPRVDCLSLPALAKGPDGRYASRRLGLPLPATIELRAQTIRAALLAFEPDVLIVDNVPRGAVGELDPALQALRARGRTACVLGLRDILDEPSVTLEEWRRAANFEAIRSFYDAIWIYGDRQVYDAVTAYRFPTDIAARASFAGYLDPKQRLQSLTEPVDPLAGLDPPPGRLALCLVGGGQDGWQLAEAFAAAQLPPDTHAIVVTGPLMPPERRERLTRLAHDRPRLHVLEFVSEPTLLLQRADWVVSMGGYNTTCELLACASRSLIVPRVAPRREQLIRAERLRDLGLLDMLHPRHLSPDALSSWIATTPSCPATVDGRIDLRGLERVPRLLTELLYERPAHAHRRLLHPGVRHVA